MSSTDVVTYHDDNQRTGENLKETTLTTSNVNSATFGKVGEFAVDGQIDGQSLFLSQLAIPGQGTKDVLYVATKNDTVYAVDAQSISGSSATILWKTSVLPSGESPATSLPCGNIRPNGITATPVIDRARNAVYVEAMSQNSAGSIIHRLHALDLTNGRELFGGPTTITATYPGTGGNSSGGVVTGANNSYGDSFAYDARDLTKPLRLEPRQPGHHADGRKRSGSTSVRAAAWLSLACGDIHGGDKSRIADRPKSLLKFLENCLRIQRMDRRRVAAQAAASGPAAIETLRYRRLTDSRRKSICGSSDLLGDGEPEH